jgi:hypothetical protein
MMETGGFIDINQHTCYKWLANIMITWNRIAMAMTLDKHTVTETLLDMAEWARDCLTQSEQFSPLYHEENMSRWWWSPLCTKQYHMINIPC